MNHIFISYSRQDEKIVDAFVKDLRDNGYNIWQDKSGAGTGIPFSTKWFDVIIEALYIAEGAIIFHSDDWEKSIPCKKEYEIIKKCGLPLLTLEIASIYHSHDNALGTVKNTLVPQLTDQENILRTKLLSRSYSFKQGVDPYLLIDDIKGVSIRKCIRCIQEVLAMNSLIKSKKYELIDPEMFPYMQRYTNFAKKAMLRRLTGILIGGVVALLAIIFVFVTVYTIPKTMEEQRDLYQSMAVSGEIDQALKNDPIYAMEKACNYDAEDLTASAFFSLNEKALQIESCHLPEMVRINVDRDKLGEMSFFDDSPEKKSVYEIQVSSHLGSIVITNQRTKNARTLNTPAHIDGYSWNEDGNQLLFWSGSRLFVYDPAGKGAPIELDECFQRIERAVFFQKGKESKILAFTESDTLLSWANPLPDKKVSRNGIEFGCFINNTEMPSAIYIYDGQIILNKNNTETVIECELGGAIQAYGYSLSHDGTKIALISNGGDKKRIVVISISSGTIDMVIEPPVDPTAVLFGNGDRCLFASSSGAGLMRIDLKTGNVQCSETKGYYHNLGNFGDYIVLTDYYGNAMLLNDDLQQVDEYWGINTFGVPFADLGIAEQKGFLFGVNRGAGETVGCARYNLITKEKDFFLIDRTNQVAANTAVAISPNEEYVAFGYPDGTIRLFETDTMYLALRYNGIGEAVSAIQISEDNSIISILGESGSIYTFKIPSLTPNDSIEAIQYNWNSLQQTFVEMGSEYYESVSEY